MTKFESEIKIIPANIDKIYATLSDLNNLERIAGSLPQDKIKDLTFDTDICSFSVQPVGTVSFRIVEREPNKTIKFGTEKSPVACFFWIQLLPNNENESKMKLTVKAELNPFIKGMVSKPLQDGLNKLADVLAAISY